MPLVMEIGGSGDAWTGVNAGQRHSSHECRDDEWRRAWEELSDSMS